MMIFQHQHRLHLQTCTNTPRFLIPVLPGHGPGNHPVRSGGQALLEGHHEGT